MSNETRWRIVEDGKITGDDAFLTATPEVAEYIVSNIIAANIEQGDTGRVEAIRADMAEGPRADAVANVRVAIGELSDAEALLNQAIDKVSNIDAAAEAVRSLAVVLADAALALRSHEDHLTPEDRGY